MLKSVQSGQRTDIRFNRAEAEAIIAFFDNLVQYKGHWAGQPLTLLDWEAFVVGNIFGWQVWDEDHQRWVRLYREAYVRVARKQGKSTLAGGIGLWCLDFDGESGAEIYAIATKRDQARQVWDVAQQMVEKSPYLSRRIHILRTVTKLIVYETVSKFTPLGRDSDTEHGLSPSLGIVDELHVHKNRNMIDAIETAIGARIQPLILYITTAGVKGASIYNETDDRARRVVSNIVKDERMFVYIACLDDDDDWKDPSNYIKANPSLGHTVQLSELIEERDKAIATPGRRNSFVRLRLDTDTDAETAWMDLDKWDTCKVPELLRSGVKHVGVDLGGRQDISAAVKVTRGPGGSLDIDCMFWMPEDTVHDAEERDGVPYSAWIEEGYLRTTPGDYRDDRAIAADLMRWSYDCAEIDLDVWNSTTLLQELADLPIETVLISQTFNSLSPAVTEVEKHVAAVTLSHLGNPVLRWMLSNTSIEENRDGGRKPVKMDASKRRRRIDGVSAMLDAVVRLIVAKEPELAWGWGAA